MDDFTLEGEFKYFCGEVISIERRSNISSSNTTETDRYGPLNLSRGETRLTGIDIHNNIETVFFYKDIEGKERSLVLSGDFEFRIGHKFMFVYYVGKNTNINCYLVNLSLDEWYTIHRNTLILNEIKTSDSTKEILRKKRNKYLLKYYAIWLVIFLSAWTYSHNGSLWFLIMVILGVSPGGVIDYRERIKSQHMEPILESFKMQAEKARTEFYNKWNANTIS